MSLEDYFNGLLEMGVINLIQYDDYLERATEAMAEYQCYMTGHNRRVEFDG